MSGEILREAWRDPSGDRNRGEMLNETWTFLALDTTQGGGTRRPYWSIDYARDEKDMHNEFRRILCSTDVS